MLTWNEWKIIANLAVIDEREVTRSNLIEAGLTNFGATRALQVMEAHSFLGDDGKISEMGTVYLSNFVESPHSSPAGE